MFCNAVGFKAYLHGACDAGTRLLFKFRSGTHGLMRNWTDIEEGRGERSAYCVMMNVRVLVMIYGSVQYTVF